MSSSHWRTMAGAWELTGPPLRPSAADVESYRAAVGAWADRHGSPRVLLLGVTPELYRMCAAAGWSVVAVDRAGPMIDSVWPGPRGRALQADWLALPLAHGSRDFVLCDGGLHLQNPVGQRRLVDQLGRLLARGGRCALRLFTAPAERESPEQVLADLFAGRVQSLDALKLRLGPALQPSTDEGVATVGIRAFLKDAGGEWPSLAARLGWPLERLRVIDLYLGSPARYHFVSVEQATSIFCGGGLFARVDVKIPSYPLGERCPLVVFERQQG